MKNQPSIAALYVDTAHGPYPKIPGVDCWDEARDARLFPGGCPAIAHPPCGPWGRMRQFSTRQQRYKHLAVIAVRQVFENGGVLEHPRWSTLWHHCDLPMPRKEIPAKAADVWALEVDQHRFGHQALKMTWLLFCGIAPSDLPPLPPRPQAKPRYVIAHSAKGATRAGYRHLPKAQRHLTPPDFATWLVAAARACHWSKALCA